MLNILGDTLSVLLAELKVRAMLDAESCVLIILGETLSEVEIDTLVDTLVGLTVRGKG